MSSWEGDEAPCSEEELRAIWNARCDGRPPPLFFHRRSSHRDQPSSDASLSLWPLDVYFIYNDEAGRCFCSKP